MAKLHCMLEPSPQVLVQVVVSPGPNPWLHLNTVVVRPISWPPSSQTMLPLRLLKRGLSIKMEKSAIDNMSRENS